MPVGSEKQYSKDASSSEDRQLVIFKIAGEEFGVDINEVKEIIRWEEVTRIPNTESCIKGVINLRGSIVVVNDLAMKLGLPSKTVDDDTRILVVEVNGNIIGMVVDSATEVLYLEGKDIQKAPDMITSGIDNNYIDGVGVLNQQRLLTLLDLTKVMGVNDYEMILQTQQVAVQTMKTEEENVKD
jgi:purine-binding chemotaxis protein CheW